MQFTAGTDGIRGLFGLGCLLVVGLIALFAGRAPDAGAAADPCPNGEIRTQQGSGHLPECRAYEMVSPLAKGGVDVYGYTMYPYNTARADGNMLAYASAGVFADAAGAGYPNIYRAARSASGWTSKAASPPQNATLLGGYGGGFTSNVYVFSADFNSAIVRTNRSLAPGASENVPNLYRRNLLTGEHDLLTTGGLSQLPFGEMAHWWAAATPDLSTVVVNSIHALTPDAPTEKMSKAYVYRNGALELASVLPGEVPSGGFAGAYGVPGGPGNTETALSDDGRLVFFEQREKGPELMDVRKGLYVRDLDARTTTEIADPSIVANFIFATPDGSKVLWKGVDPDVSAFETLHLYDVASGDSVALTDHISEDSGIAGVLDVSEDLSSIYFVLPQGAGKLVPGQPDPPADSPDPHPFGIYRWQPETGEITFVAYFAGEEAVSNADRLAQESSGYESVEARQDVAATRDGSVLAFATRMKVMPAGESGYENASASCENGRCQEVYRYSAEDEELTCVSCPAGTPSADAGMANRATKQASTTQLAFSQPRLVSADGSKVFFESGEQLAAGDTNSRTDVYMWRNGAPELLSGGTSQYHSRLLEASASGDDVFFVTREPLVGWDRDDLVDVYDARVGGGFPEPPPPPAADCVGSACQGAAAPPPAALTPASARINGRGNARPCRRGQKPKRAKKGAKASAKQGKKKRSGARKCRGAK